MRKIKHQPNRIAKKSHVVSSRSVSFPRLPLEAELDLTYRCNNNCRHCWLRIPADAEDASEELSADRIREIVEEARSLGCRTWSISGGEPLLRPDFADIFEIIIKRAASFTLNTNGTLLTPSTARLFAERGKNKGKILISIYGSEADIHDHITRTPGSHEALLQGIACLREARAEFTLQIVVMKDNFGDYGKMVEWAESRNIPWRLGASWLYLSAAGDPTKNREIREQRLPPEDVIELDGPLSPLFEGKSEKAEKTIRLYAGCIAEKKGFHVDPYGGMSFCSLVKDPSLRYDLKNGTVVKGWDNFIPSVADRIFEGEEYARNCAICGMRRDCPWCPVYAYLEHGRPEARVDYLCSLTRAGREKGHIMERSHRRFFEVGGISIEVRSDIPFQEDTFAAKFELFASAGPGKDAVLLQHHFAIPPLSVIEGARKIYHKPPWAVYEKDGAWIYLGIHPEDSVRSPHRVAVFNHDHTRANIYHESDEMFRRGRSDTLSFFPSDQIILARILADREGCTLHASGLLLDGNGLVFTGPSGAGKTTISGMMEERGLLLCDDRIILRRGKEGFDIFGTWGHGDNPSVSPMSGPLSALFFLHQSTTNRLVRLTDNREKVNRILPRIFRPLVTADWWEKTFSLVEHIVQEVPCFDLEFDRSGGIVEQIKEVIR